jgi:hypothetical protein
LVGDLLADADPDGEAEISSDASPVTDEDFVKVVDNELEADGVPVCHELLISSVGDDVFDMDGDCLVRDRERVTQHFPNPALQDVVVSATSLLRDDSACANGVECNHEQADETVMADAIG